MIPKIIHFCWLSDDPFPDSIAYYMATWKKILPDYEFKLWNFNIFPKDKSKWVSDAFDAKKYAFAADYLRCYALYTEGGIYLDSDVEVLKSFNPLLHLPYFFGYENGSGCIEAGIMGSEPRNQIFQHILDYYDSHPFMTDNGTPDILPIPRRLLSAIDACGMTRNDIPAPECFNPDPKIVNVLPFYYFSPLHLETKRLESTSETITIHHFAATWQSPWHNFKDRIKHIVGADFTEWFIKAKRKILGRTE